MRGRQRRIHVEVVVLGDGSGGLVDLREYGRHALGRRRRRGQEAHVAAAIFLHAKLKRRSLVER